MKNASLTTKSSSLSNGWPIKWLRERCPTNWYQGQRSFMWYLKSYTSDVIPIFGSVHKNARFKPQPSTPMWALASMRSTPFMEIEDKGGEIVQRYKNFGRDWDKEVEVGHGHEQRVNNIEEYERIKRIKILRQEKHTSRGSKIMNLIGCIWYVHIHVLACIA